MITLWLIFILMGLFVDYKIYKDDKDFVFSAIGYVCFMIGNLSIAISLVVFILKVFP
jgi:hypothetical protein